jgi:glutathione S-transferase
VINRFLRPVIFKTEGDEDAAKAAEQAVLRPLDYLEGVLTTGGWLAGDYSIGDLSLACAVKTLSYAGWAIDAERHPSLANWYARVGERAAWRLAAEQEAAVFASLGG